MADLTITITIPEARKTEVINAFAKQYKYQTQIQDPEDETGTTMIDNPVSKAQFALNIVKTFIKEVYIGSKVGAVKDTIQAAAVTANTEIDGVTVA